jgi:ABC-type multidrug transport system ATPase subunit
MEEADVLGEKIGIMAGGQLKCVGDPLHLKNRFGPGYRINVVTEVDRTEEAKKIILTMVPGTKLLFCRNNNK